MSNDCRPSRHSRGLSLALSMASYTMEHMRMTLPAAGRTLYPQLHDFLLRPVLIAGVPCRHI